jgi:hypothetical protein
LFDQVFEDVRMLVMARETIRLVRDQDISWRQAGDHGVELRSMQFAA